MKTAVAAILFVCIVPLIAEPPPFDPGTDTYPDWYQDTNADTWIEPSDFISFFSMVRGGGAADPWYDSVQDGLLDYRDLFGWIIDYYDAAWPIFEPVEIWENFYFREYSGEPILAGFTWRVADKPDIPGGLLEPDRYVCSAAIMYLDFNTFKFSPIPYPKPSSWPTCVNYARICSMMQLDPYLHTLFITGKLPNVIDVKKNGNGFHIIGFKTTSDPNMPIGYYLHYRYSIWYKFYWLPKFIPLAIDVDLTIPELEPDCYYVPQDLQMLKRCWTSPYDFTHYAEMANRNGVFDPLPPALTMQEVIDAWLMPYGFIDYAKAANNFNGEL